MMNKGKLKIIAGILFLFLMGSLVGGLGTHMFFQHRLKQFVKGPEAFFVPRFMKRIEKKLDLSRDQRKKVKKILFSLKEKLGEFRQTHDPELKQIIQDHVNQVKKELDPEQQVKLDRFIEKIQKKERRRPPRGRHMGKKRWNSGLQRLKEDLNLSDEQVEKIRPLIKARRQQEKEMNRALKKILTAEQFEDYREKRPGGGQEKDEPPFMGHHAPD